jgi:hypothetical protein
MKRLAIVLVLVLVTAALAANPEEFATSAGTLQLTPIQHASLMIRAGGKVLYIDPAQGKYDGRPAADYILITDIHIPWRPKPQPKRCAPATPQSCIPITTASPT